MCSEGRDRRRKGRAGGPEDNAATMLVGLCLRFGETEVRKLSTSHSSREHFEHPWYCRYWLDAVDGTGALRSVGDTDISLTITTQATSFVTALGGSVALIDNTQLQLPLTTDGKGQIGLKATLVTLH